MREKVKRSIAASLILLLSILLFGCGEAKLDDEKVKDDLLNNDYFYMNEGCELTEFNIIKSLTDDVNKTKTLYVSITIDHELAQEKRAYIMNYTEYDEGWGLDSVESYYGDEVTWESVPKNNPSAEFIMDEITSHSNELIKNNFDEYYPHVDDEMEDIYFFEDGKYSCNIYPTDTEISSMYNCILEINRVFELVEVKEILGATFNFNYESYEWTLFDVYSLDLEGDWYLEGDWTTYLLDGKYTCSETYAYFEGSQSFEFEQDMDDDYSVEVGLRLPSALKIFIGQEDVENGDYGGPYSDIEISPDKIQFYRRYSESGSSHENWDHLSRVSGETPKALETTGFTEINVAPEAIEYAETAQDMLEALFVNKDAETAKALMYTELYEGSANDLDEYLDNIILESEFDVFAVCVNPNIDIIKRDDNSLEQYYMSWNNIDESVEEIGICNCYMRCYDEDGEVETTPMEVYLIKTQGQIYVGGF